MGEYFTSFKDWIVTLSREHEVDPLMLGILYLCSKVCLVLFLAWVLKNFRAKKPLLTPLIFVALSYALPYGYLVITGRDISVWIYLLIAAVFMLGGYGVWRRIAAKTEVLEKTKNH